MGSPPDRRDQQLGAGCLIQPLLEAAVLLAGPYQTRGGLEDLATVWDNSCSNNTRHAGPLPFDQWSLTNNTGDGVTLHKYDYR